MSFGHQNFGRGREGFRMTERIIRHVRDIVKSFWHKIGEAKTARNEAVKSKNY